MSETTQIQKILRDLYANDPLVMQAADYIDRLKSELSEITDERLERISEFCKNLSIFCVGVLLGLCL